jgi:hypothetical protein
MTMTEREFWIIIRSALLLFVDAIEKRYDLPRTAEIKQLMR